MTRPRIAPRVGTLRSTAVNQVLREAAELQKNGRELISLMRGQPDTPTPLPIVEAAMQSLRAGRTGYPDNQGELPLRRAIADKLRRDNGIDVDPATEILVTDGATAGISLALAALLRPDDEVLLPDPIYDAYASVIALWGGKPVGARATIRDGRFCLDRAALEAARTPQTRLLLLNTPWNPVGTVFTAEELATIMDFAAAHDLLVISDEIYEALIFDGKRHVSPASLSSDARGRTVLVNSLSKTYAMTGWRVGYCAGPGDVIRAMLLIYQQWSRGPATFVQDAAAVALRLDANWCRKLAAEYQARRDRTMHALSGIPGVTPLRPEGGLFVMLDVRGLGMPSDEVRRRLLQEAGIVLIHGAAYGPGGEGTLRVSFAAGGAALDRGLDRLRESLLSFAQR